MANTAKHVSELDDDSIEEYSMERSVEDVTLKKEKDETETRANVEENNVYEPETKINMGKIKNKTEERVNVEENKEKEPLVENNKGQVKNKTEERTNAKFIQIIIESLKNILVTNCTAIRTIAIIYFILMVFIMIQVPFNDITIFEYDITVFLWISALLLMISSSFLFAEIKLFSRKWLYYIYVIFCIVWIVTEVSDRISIFLMVVLLILAEITVLIYLNQLIKEWKKKGKNVVMNLI